jgi:Zinc carboxypeptidase
MLRTLLFVTLISLFYSSSISQELKSPSEFLGYELGSYFTRHHQVMDYFDHLEEFSNGQLIVKEYGRTNENRRLMTAVISSAVNIKYLENIRGSHRVGESEAVAIVWLSYNVHGNESSCTEAAMKTAYKLITEHSDWLENTLVIIDPCLNPDGRDRYVNWYNQQKNVHPNENRLSAEHNEPWPAGRFNHYLFDLNRDWAWLTQVESRQRIKLYNQWLPHVHVDFHEQFYDSPYYFAPAAAPFHDVITDWQKEFQNGLGRQHAKYFDQEGWLYFTREIFDLLYPGYGDTYPTFNGAIGMTYEQGGHGVAGLTVETDEKDTLTLKDRIEHHLTTGLSTVEYSAKQKEKLISEFQAFQSNQDFKYKSYAVWGNYQKMRLLIDLMEAHGILYKAGDGQKVSGYEYSTGENGQTTVGENHLIISTNQRKGALLSVLFEPKTQIEDSVTYDLTAWSLPYAYGLNCIASEQKIDGVESLLKSKSEIFPINLEDAYAYLIKWGSMSSARVLTSLLAQKVKVRYAEKPFTFGEDKYGAGTLIVLRAENNKLDLDKIIQKACKANRIAYSTTTTGMVDTGKDFGSPKVKKINPPKVALLTKQGFPATIGEYWYYFEQQLNYPITLINTDRFNYNVLQEMDVLIVPGGSFKVPDSLLANWVIQGGKLIAVGTALKNFGPKSKFKIRSKKFDKKKEDEVKKDEYKNALLQYSDKSRIAIGKAVQGAIYKCKVDNTNPLAFGYGKEYFTLKYGADTYNWLKNGENPVYLDGEITAESGFVGNKVKKDQPKSMVFSVEKKGKGAVIYMVDNPLFRGFWENGKLFMANAVFFVNN